MTTTPKIHPASELVCFERTGEVRKPKAGEFFAHYEGPLVSRAQFNFLGRTEAILQPLPNAIAFTPEPGKRYVLLCETDDANEATHWTCEGSIYCINGGSREPATFHAKPWYTAVPIAPPEPTAEEVAAKVKLRAWQNFIDRHMFGNGYSIDRPEWSPWSSGYDAHAAIAQKAGDELFQENNKLRQSIILLEFEQLTLASAYDPNCEEYHFTDQLDAMKAAGQLVEDLQELAQFLGRDPEGCLRDVCDEAMGIIEGNIKRRD